MPDKMQCSGCAIEVAATDDHTTLNHETQRDGKTIYVNRVYCSKCERPILEAVHGYADLFP